MSYVSFHLDIISILEPFTCEICFTNNSFNFQPIKMKLGTNYVYTPATRVWAIYRTPLGCYENLIRSDLFVYPSRRSVYHHDVIKYASKPIIFVGIDQGAHELSCMFIAALLSPAGKGLTSWLLLVMSIVFLLLSHVVSWVKCGTCLYIFLIFAIFLTFKLCILGLRQFCILAQLCCIFYLMTSRLGVK